MPSEIETLKIVKNLNQQFKTPDVQHFKTSLRETETITLLELPSLTSTGNNVQNSRDTKVCIIFSKM